MIKAVFSKDDDAKKVGLHIEAHAGQSEYGKDVVCASASILLYTIAQIVNAIAQLGDFAEEPIKDITDGEATISCICKNKMLYSELVYAFFVVQTGYSLLEDNYPKYLKLNMFGEA